MTRILEALRKYQGRAATFPFPPAHAPAAVPRPLEPVGAAAEEITFVPQIELLATAPLPEEVTRQMTAMRVAIEASLEDVKTRVVLFTSSMSTEGVSTVSTSFASALAADGRVRALLVDANPRTTAAAGRGGPAGATGGAGKPALAVAVLGDEIRRAGGRAQAALRAFLATASTQFDWVIVDAPPVLEVAESVDLCPTADGVVLVVRSGHTRRPVALRAAELLRKSGIRILGAVLNRRRFEIPGFIYRRI